VKRVLYLIALVGCSEPAEEGSDPRRGTIQGSPPATSAPTSDAGTPVGPDADAADSSTPPPPKVLAAPVAALAAEVAMRSPGTEVGIAVLDLTTAEYAGQSDTVRHVSASSPKAVWAAAALDVAGIDAVEPYAAPVFESSDNTASGTLIDLAGGMNAMNVFYTTKAGMADSAITQWFGGRAATNSPRKMGSDNYFTAKDAVTFLERLDRGLLLDAAKTKKLEEWMTWSPRKGFGGWLGTLLPSAAQATMMHKGGWLPPGCCGDDSEYNTLNEIGIVETANAHRYAIAILARRGDDWYGKQAPWVERASCVIHRAVSADQTLDCND
jgi:beta-lactamase class A